MLLIQIVEAVSVFLYEIYMMTDILLDVGSIRNLYSTQDLYEAVAALRDPDYSVNRFDFFMRFIGTRHRLDRLSFLPPPPSSNRLSLTLSSFAVDEHCDVNNILCTSTLVVKMPRTVGLPMASVCHVNNASQYFHVAG